MNVVVPANTSTEIYIPSSDPGSIKINDSEMRKTSYLEIDKFENNLQET